MKKSLLSTPSGPNRRRHTPYNWNSHKNANKRGYPPSTNSSYQCSSAYDRTQQICSGDFIPLDMSTPVTQYRRNDGNWHSPRSGRNDSSPDSGWCYNRSNYSAPRFNNNFNNANARCNYRNNYYTPSRLSNNSLFSPYKQSFKQLYKQRKDDKGVHRRVNISDYIDMPSCLEDPWEHLMKMLNNSKGANNDKTQTESSSNLKLVDNDSTEKLKSELEPRDVNLNDSHSSQESKIDSSLDTTFGEDITNVSQMSKADSSIDLEIGNICFNQDSIGKSANSITDSAAGTMGEKDNAHLDEPVADTDEKNISQ